MILNYLNPIDLHTPPNLTACCATDHARLAQSKDAACTEDSPV